jgi:uncharacterized protein (TIRG00374 family)
VVYWVLPVVILGLIVTRIDLVVLVDTVRSADPLLYAFGVLFFPVAMLIGSLRWKVLIRQYLGVAERFGYLFRHYYIGFSVSIFLPGQIGMDIYRIAIAGRRFQRYGANIAIVLEEKFVSLTVSLGLVLGITPWLGGASDALLLGSIVDVALGILVGSLAALTAVWLFARLAAGKKLAKALTSRLQQLFVSMMARLNRDTSKVGPMPPVTQVFAPLLSPGKLLPVVGLSTGIYLSLAFANLLFLDALGYKVPFVVSLFVIAVLFVVVSLPISFAGFGVREGAYIVLLGLFGVPPETALVVSLFALSGALFNYALGGGLIYASREATTALVSRTH